MLRKIVICFYCVALLLAGGLRAEAAPVENFRTSISGAKVRLVLDSKEPIKYSVIKNDKEILIELPESRSKSSVPKINDALVQSVLLQQTRKSSKLRIKLTKNCDYKVFALQNPHRLVIDLYKIEKIDRTSNLLGDIKYRFIQDELNGRQYQAHIVSAEAGSQYELRPFSAAGTYNGRGSLAGRARSLGLIAAVNASYFDTDGWVIGVTKDRGKLLSVDETPRSAYISKGGVPAVVKDVSYSAYAMLPGGARLPIKGMNRARIAEDCVLFNEGYATSTKTNQWGRELKIKNGRVIAVSTLGNMSIEAGTSIISAHGAGARALEKVRVGDSVSIVEALGSVDALQAETVVGGGPLLLEGGKINVRTAEERIAKDIAVGRAPRTAVGVKADGSVMMVVVDGRSSASAGMTLTELAGFLLKLGAQDAVNFDGGGSSEMVIRGNIVNRPSDGKERLISMGMGLFRK